MKIEILEKKDNFFLKREERTILVENEVCPKKEELLANLGLDPSVSLIKKIYSSFGKNKFKAEVFIYASKEDKEKVEKIPRKVRKKMLEEIKKQQENKSSEKA